MQEKTAIFFHADCDGIISAVNVIRSFGPGADLFPIRNHESVAERVAKAKGKYEKIYILDLGSVDPKIVNSLRARVTIIDHHESEPIMGKGIIHLNPRFSGKPPYPVSYQTYILLGGLDWQAFIGVVDDWAVGILPTFVNRFWKEYGWVGTQENLYLYSDAGKIAAAIESGVKVYGEDKGGKLGVEALLACSTPREFLQGKGAAAKLLAAREKIFAEVGKVMKKISTDEGKVSIVFLKSRYNIKREIIQRLKIENPGKTVFVFRKVGRNWEFSGRGKNLVELVRPYGGGHPEAVGGTVPAKHLKTFTEKIRTYLG